MGAGLDLLFPIQCAGCGKSGAVWCDECDAATVWLEEPLCSDCGYPLENRKVCPSCHQRKPALRVRSSAMYSGRVAQALLHLKYRPNKQLASVMAGWMHRMYVREGWSAGIVVPVPLSKHRIQQRGFNQASLLAGALGRQIGLPIEAGKLARVVDTPSQVGLDPEERWHNVRKAFEATSFEGTHVLLVDDLFTTGATLSACALAARAAGAQSVQALTVARA